MKNNTENTTEIPEQKSKRVRYPQFEDRDDARRETDKLFEHAKELLAQILMVTSGCSVVTGTNEEWGHENLVELLEIFQIRHKNFERGLFAENLSDYLFTWTKAHTETNRKWKAEILRKSEIASIVAADYSDFEETAAADKSSDNYDIDLLAVQLSEVLNNPNLPAKLYNIITDELCENHSDTTSPDYIKANLMNNSRLRDA